MSLSLTHVIYNFFEVKYTNVVLVSLMLMSSLHVDQIEKGTSKKKKSKQLNNLLRVWCQIRS